MMNVTATDADDPTTTNAILSYSILKQTPEDPMPGLFTINSASGLISCIAAGLDREVSDPLLLIAQVTFTALQYCKSSACTLPESAKVLYGLSNK